MLLEQQILSPLLEPSGSLFQPDINLYLRWQIFIFIILSFIQNKQTNKLTNCGVDLLQNYNPSFNFPYVTTLFHLINIFIWINISDLSFLC